MTTFYFDLQDGDSLIKDDEGLDLPDIETAQIEAAEYLADAIIEISMRPSQSTGYAMSVEVRDLEGQVFVLGYVLRSIILRLKTRWHRVVRFTTSMDERASVYRPKGELI